MVATTGSGSGDPEGATTSARRAHEPDDDQTALDLDVALDGLSHLAVGVQSLEASLRRIAELAVTAIPGADGVGVTMLEPGHSDTVCASHAFVYDVDRIQYDLGEGPCITAAAEARTVVSGALDTDPSWPRLRARFRDLDVTSIISFPLLMPDGEVMGAMNVYAYARDAFSTEAADKGEAFAAAAAVTVNTARALMQAHRLVDHLKAALGSRATIDQAIGIVMSRPGGTPEDAFATLRRLSQNRNVKLAALAENIVREAVGRARARHGAEPQA